MIEELLSSLPIPQTVFEITWFIIGVLLAHTLGSKLDEDTLGWIDKRFDGRKRVWLIKGLAKLLNFIHHAWIGLLGVIYFGAIPIAQSIGLPITIPSMPNAELFWLCLGITIDDLQYHVRASMHDGFINKLKIISHD